MILIELIKIVVKNIVVINRKKIEPETTGNRIDAFYLRLKHLDFDRKFYLKKLRF